MKIFCIGRNYSEHVLEMKSEIPTTPIFFMKPDTALLKENEFYYPKFTNDLHYECEIVVKINKVGKNITEEFAAKYYSEIGLGIDFTARDLQQECKTKGLPWELAKSWENSAPIGSIWLEKSSLNLENLEFSLAKNGSIVQSGNSSKMTFKIDKLIAYLSQFHTLKVGDLIFTGTPAGVGPVQIGDVLEGKINEIEMFRLKVK